MADKASLQDFSAHWYIAHGEAEGVTFAFGLRGGVAGVAGGAHVMAYLFHVMAY